MQNVKKKYRHPCRRWRSCGYRTSRRPGKRPQRAWSSGEPGTATGHGRSHLKVAGEEQRIQGGWHLCVTGWKVSVGSSPAHETVEGGQAAAHGVLLVDGERGGIGAQAARGSFRRRRWAPLGDGVGDSPAAMREVVCRRQGSQNRSGVGRQRQGRMETTAWTPPGLLRLDCRRPPQDWKGEARGMRGSPAKGRSRTKGGARSVGSGTGGGGGKAFQRYGNGGFWGRRRRRLSGKQRRWGLEAGVFQGRGDVAVWVNGDELLVFFFLTRGAYLGCFALDRAFYGSYK
jgi:hypothetical protein